MYPAIELFRGIAAWMVLSFHYAYFFTTERTILSFFWSGVDLFFVISGFVFAHGILKGKIALLPYFTRRFFRIYPLYLISLLLYYGLTPTHTEKFSYFLHHLHFWHTTQSVQEANFFNVAYWTLPVEVEFYLLVPLLAVMIRYYLVIPILLIIALLIKFWITFHATNPFDPNFATILIYHLPNFLLEFLAGILLFHYYTQYRDKTLKNHLVILMVALAFLILLMIVWVNGYTNEEVNSDLWLISHFRFLCAVAYAMLLFPALFLIQKPDTVVYSMCMWMGNLSYGMYLFHNLIPLIAKSLNYQLIGMMAYLGSLAITVMISFLGYLLVEQPARRFGRKLAQRFN